MIYSVNHQNSPSSLFIRTQLPKPPHFIAFHSYFLPIGAGPHLIQSLPFLSLHITTIIVPLTSIPAPQNTLNLDRITQLTTKPRSRPTGSGTGISILGKRNIAGPLVARIPDLPPGSVDDVGHAGLLERHAGVFAPGTPEVVGARGDRVAVGGGDGAGVEDVVVWVSGGVAAGGYGLVGGC